MKPDASTLLENVRSAAGNSRRRATRAALDAARPWEEWRPALGRALAADPSGAAGAVAALAVEAGRRTDRLFHARLQLFEAYAAHRAGRLNDAIALYVKVERQFERAGSPGEAVTTAIARVDALATTGRVAAALSLADRLAGRLSGTKGRSARAILASNRGNALRLRGDYDEARRAYAAATRGFERLGDRRRAEVTRLNGAVTAVEAGDADRGRAEIEKARRALVEGGFADLALEARANLAWANVLSGRLGEGIRELDRLADEHRVAGLSRREGICRMDLADALRRAGDATTGAREAVRAAACFARVDAAAERAEALAIAAAASALPLEARSLSKQALAAARGSGREALALRVELSRLTDRPAADDEPLHTIAARRIARRAHALGQRALEAEARVVEGALELATGRVPAARTAFSAARRLAKGRPWTRMAADAGLADVDAQRPAGVSRAIERLRGLSAHTDLIGADLPGSWLRSRFAADRLDPHLLCVELLLARGRDEDRLEARTILDTLAAKRVLLPRARRGDPRAHRIRARLEAIYDRIARGDGAARGGEGASTAALELRAHTLEKAFVAQRGRFERHQPAAVRSRAPAGRAIDARATWIHVWRRGDHVSALVDVDGDVGGDIQGAIELPPLVAWLGWSRGVRLHAARYRHDRNAGTGAAADLLQTIAGRLLPALFADRWSRDVRLTIDPMLPDLPFESLPWNDRPLGLAHALVRTPLGRLAPVARRRGTGCVVLGVGAAELPGVGDEVRRVAEVMPDARVLEGADATRAALADALTTAAVVHVAGHGWDAADAPPLAGVRLADGWFCADDVPDRVGADLVVLAACRTGRAVGAASLAWGGLVSRLLSSGARRVVSTDDDVDDQATARLMADFHATRRQCDDVTAFGRSLAHLAEETRHVGAVLPFRISGVVS